MMIWSVPCNGKPECRDNLDEWGCSASFQWLIVGTCLSAFVVAFAHGLVHWTLSVAYTSTKANDLENTERSMKPHKLENCTNDDLRILAHLLDQPRCVRNAFKQWHYIAYASLHNRESFPAILESIIDTSQLLLKKAQSQVINRNLYELEMNYHHGDPMATMLCLKKLLGTKGRTQVIIDDNFPTAFMSITSSKPAEYLKDNRLFRLTKLYMSITLAYIDFVKDVSVLVTMFNVAGKFFNSHMFSLCITQILTQSVTILFSLVLSSLYCCSQHPSGLFGFLIDGPIRASGGLLKVLTFLLSPLLQGLLMMKIFLIEDCIRKMKNETLTLFESVRIHWTEIKRLTGQKTTLANLFYQIRVLELTFETYPQVLILMVLISLKTSTTKTHSAFQAIYDEGEDAEDPPSIGTFLTLSVSIGVISCCQRMLQHCIAQKAGFSLFVGKVIFCFRYLI